MKSLRLLTLSALSASILLLNGCGSGDSNDNSISSNTLEGDPTKLIKIWETDAILSTPESVLYDKNKKVIYASNVNRGSSKDSWTDNDGFVSKIDENGKILSKKWIVGLQAPKGLALNGEHLYIADINSIVEVNTTNGTILNTFNTPTDHINDLSFDSNKNVLYLSDSDDKKIFKMTTKGAFSLVYDRENGSKDYQNGIFVDNKKLIMQAQKGYLKSIDLDTNTVTTISDKLKDIKYLDGIWKYGDKGYIVSDWRDKIYFVRNDGEATLLLTTEPERSADISYSDELKLLLVPDFDKKIKAYEIE